MGLGNNKKSELKYHTDVEEFIPYAAHFDEETIITKNGELLQIIKLTGFASEAIKEEKDGVTSLRTLIREAIKKKIKTDDFAFWIHTIRRQKDISTGGAYPEGFAKELNEKWIEKHGWRTQFVNELYITIISEGDIFPIKNPKTSINSLFTKTQIRDRKEKLLANAKKLSGVTSEIIKELEIFGARKLNLFKRDGVYYSELMSFASKLMNLRQEDIPMQTADLSSVLPTHKVSFQYNTVLVEGATGKHFGAIFSVKDYREVTDSELDRLIQLPVNFIISQSFDFVSKEKVLSEFEGQKKIYEISGAKRMVEISGLKEIYDADQGETDFGESQIIITVLEDTVRAMQKAVSEVVDTLREMGVAFIREDLFMENCYWSVMPANFDFIKRISYMPFSKIGGFASLHNFTTGKLENNFWGNAVTTFPTRGNRPYFFNFHNEDNGHTVIVGRGERKKIVANFLMSQASKFHARTFVVESANESEVFTKAMNGLYLADESEFAKYIENKEHNFLAFNIEASKERFAELMNKIEGSLDEDAPAIILISEQFSAITDAGFGDMLAAQVQRLSGRNVMMIFLSDGSTGIFGERMTDMIKTKIFLPQPEAGFDLKELFRLKEKELKEIKKLHSEKGELLIKRNNDSVIVMLDLPKNEKYLQTLLSAPEKTG